MANITVSNEFTEKHALFNNALFTCGSYLKSLTW